MQLTFTPNQLTLTPNQRDIEKDDGLFSWAEERKIMRIAYRLRQSYYYDLQYSEPDAPKSINMKNRHQVVSFMQGMRSDESCKELSDNMPQDTIDEMDTHCVTCGLKYKTKNKEKHLKSKTHSEWDYLICKWQSQFK